MNRVEIRQSLLLLLTATIWGVAFVAQSVGMDYVGPLTFNCVRSLLGGVVLIPCIWFLDRREGQKELRESGGKRTGCNRGASRELLAGGIICGLLLCLASNFQQIGIAHTSVGKAGFITALYIVIVPILGLLLFHKKCRPLIWLGVCLAVAGLYFLCMAGGDGLTVTEQMIPGIPIGKGDFLVFICALLFSGHILAIDYFTERADGVKMSCIQFWVCGIVSGIGMFLMEDPQIHAILMAWKELLYAGVMSCGVAYTLQIVGQKGMDPTVASLILSLESVISALAGLFILGQRLSGAEILGCILMFAAIVLAQLAGAEKKPSPSRK